MIRKVEHIGIAVSSMEESNRLFEKLLGVAPYKVEQVQSEQVSTSFFQVGETKIELLSSLGSEGPIGKYISKRGEGVHHLAFFVDNIKEEMARLKKEGFELLSEEPRKGADNKLICFLHPRSTNGVLVELCEEIK